MVTVLMLCTNYATIAFGTVCAVLLTPAQKEEIIVLRGCRKGNKNDQGFGALQGKRKAFGFFFVRKKITKERQRAIYNHGMGKVAREPFFSFHNTRTQGHSGEGGRQEIQEGILFFHLRCNECIWHSLPQNVVMALNGD